jgi:membrane protease YdiL (CAAX protease family)
MLGFDILLSELDNVLNYFLPVPQFLKDTFELMMVKPLFIISIIWAGIIPAFAEEMLFRGVILNGFKENYSEKKAIIVSALLFGLYHLNPWQFVLAFIIGLFSAFICLRTGSIALSIYIHFFNNVMSVVVLRYKDIIPIKGIGAAYSKYPEKVFQPMWFDLIGLVIMVVGIILLRNGIKKLGEAKNGA